MRYIKNFIPKLALSRFARHMISVTKKATVTASKMVSTKRITDTGNEIDQVWSDAEIGYYLRQIADKIDPNPQFKEI